MKLARAALFGAASSLSSGSRVGLAASSAFGSTTLEGTLQKPYSAHSDCKGLYLEPLPPLHADFGFYEPELHACVQLEGLPPARAQELLARVGSLVRIRGHYYDGTFHFAAISELECAGTCQCSGHVLEYCETYRTYPAGCSRHCVRTPW